MKEYINEIKKELKALLPECRIKEHSIVKRNDQVLYGINIIEKEGEPAPTFYVNEPFNIGVPPKEVASVFAEKTEEFSKLPRPVEKASELENLSFEKIKDSLSLRLVDVSKNIKYLSEHPHKDLGNGFAYIVAYNLSEEYSIVITNDQIKYHRFDFEALYEAAMENSKDDIVFASLNPLDMDKIGDPEFNYYVNENIPEGYMFVLTNRKFQFGASVMFFPGVLDKIKLLLNENFYIIPSSVHEVLVIRESFVEDKQTIAQMLYEGNMEICAQEDYLTDKAMKYSTKLETF